MSFFREELLAAGDTCDFVSMGRQLLADPDIPNKLAAGRPDLVRTCISCFVCVARNFWDDTPVCAVNSRLGHVVVASGVRPDPALAEALSAAGVHAVAIGDCAQVGYIEGAIHSAAAVATLGEG